MSGILNKLGLGHSSSSEASHSTTSHSSTSSTSHSSSTHHTQTAPSTSSTTTVNKTGYADNVGTTSAYAHTNPAAIQSQTTTTTTTTTAANTAAVGTTAAAHTHAAHAEGDAYMTRSEERLLVGKEQVGAGVASLNKYVTSEHVHTAVPITREHVVIEREPITAADGIRGAEIKEAHIEVALTEERAVAAKETVAVEKVKLRKEVEHTTQNVDAELRKEHIEFGTTNETTYGNKTLGAAPGTAGYTATTTDKTYTNTTGANIDPVANPRV